MKKILRKILSRFFGEKQKRIARVKRKLIYDIACDHYAEEARTNDIFGIVDIFPTCKAITYTKDVIRKGLVNKKFKLLTDVK